MIELIFNKFIERRYLQHETIQRSEDRKLQNKSLELNEIDDLAVEFEQTMEITAFEMEQWIIKNKK